MLVEKALVDSLYNENISHKEYKRNVAKINEAVNEIWRWIIEESGRIMEWWAFQNDVSYGHGNGSSGGEFDPLEDKEWIEIQGEYTLCKIPGYLYNSGFPTSFLWEDYKSIVTKHLEEIAEKSKSVSESRKKRTAELKRSVRRKLTKEELSIIYFKV